MQVPSTVERRKLDGALPENLIGFEKFQFAKSKTFQMAEAQRRKAEGMLGCGNVSAISEIQPALDPKGI